MIPETYSYRRSFVPCVCFVFCIISYTDFGNIVSAVQNHHTVALVGFTYTVWYTDFVYENFWNAIYAKII